jgi:hypothetical protein
MQTILVMVHVVHYNFHKYVLHALYKNTKTEKIHAMRAIQQLYKH